MYDYLAGKADLSSRTHLTKPRPTFVRLYKVGFDDSIIGATYPERISTAVARQHHRPDCQGFSTAMLLDLYHRDAFA